MEFKVNYFLIQTKKAKESLISDLSTIEQKETELVKSLQEKYGQGNIDLETGEITLDQQ